MTIAFDVGGVLELSPTLQDLYRSLQKEHAVHIISAISVGHEDWQTKRIKDWRLWIDGRVHFVLMTEVAKPDGVYERKIGHMKADVMVKIGAAILIDDNPYICESVRDRGLIALQYRHPH